MQSYRHAFLLAAHGIDISQSQTSTRTRAPSYSRLPAIAFGNPEKNKRMGYSTVFISQPRSPNMSRSKELIRDKSEVGMSMYECAEVSHHML